jgi:hypothetical protein
MTDPGDRPYAQKYTRWPARKHPGDSHADTEAVGTASMGGKRTAGTGY